MALKARRPEHVATSIFKNIICDTALPAGTSRVRFHAVSLKFLIYLLLSAVL